MNYEAGSDVLGFLVGMVVGAAVGAGVALLWAPRSGRLTRRRMRTAMESGFEGAEERWERLGDDVRSAMRTGRRRLEL